MVQERGEGRRNVEGTGKEREADLFFFLPSITTFNNNNNSVMIIMIKK